MKALICLGTFCVAVIAPGLASAAVQIAGGSSLLTQAYADQLGTWLGEGDLTLTNIYTTQAGDDSFDFHAAADLKGRTFTVIEVPANSARDAQTGLTNNAYQIIGGYNPLSWDSVSWYHTDAGRTAFIFNLTTSEKFTQNLDSTGQYQTRNWPTDGPFFGNQDIIVGSNLHSGSAFDYSYGGGNFATDNILAGSASYHNSIAYGDIEVFTITNGISAVPEYSSVVVWGILCLVVGSGSWYRRIRG